MPLVVVGGRVPPRWALHVNYHQASSAWTDHISIAMINNMPDAALEDTELQFFALLEDASGHIPILLKLYSLTGVPRTERGQRHLDNFYYPLDQLWQNRFDGVIITGTEPRCPDLRDEPYWKYLAAVFDWAESNTSSAILSCLAAHAGVLHSDGVGRHRLPDKKFGVFEFGQRVNHPFVTGISGPVRFPHSRWNEVKAEELVASGYTLLTQAADGGVDTFVKKKAQSLFLHFQGHPEYEAETLLKEYRRDIRRFLTKERETYPTMPRGYFDASAEKTLTDFRELVLREPREELMAGFPDSVLSKTLGKTWELSATTIYGNWLRYLVARKKERADTSAADRQWPAASESDFVSQSGLSKPTTTVRPRE